MLHTPAMRLGAATFGLCGALSICGWGAVAAKPVRGALQAGCGPNLVFLVWPHGHPAIPRFAEFPRIPNPHIELYVGFKGYDATDAGAWAIGGTPPKGITRGGFFTNCTNYGDTVTTGTVANAQVITKQSAVKCVVKGSPAVDVKLRARGVADFYLHSGNAMIATAHVTANGVKLTVPKNCTLIAPPHP
jgi:hypothetical protein